MTSNLTTRIKAVAKRLATAERNKGAALFDAAVLYGEAVVDGTMSQGDYAVALYGGTGKANGTLLKRLHTAVTVVGITQDDPAGVWPFLVQRATSKAVGDVLADATPDNRSETLSALKQVEADFNAPKASKGNGKRAARTAGDGTDKGAKAEPEVARTATVDDVLRALDTMVKGLDSEAWASVESRLQTIITREVTVRTKAATPAPRKSRARKAA